MPSVVRFTLASLVLAAAGTASAHAQFAVYALGSGGFVGSSNVSSQSQTSNSFHTWGGTFGVYDDAVSLGPLKLGADARYFQETSSNNSSYDNKLHGGLAGLRLALKLPVLPKPYIQAEVGGVGTNYGAQANNVGSFAYQVQGGVDFTVFPHVDVRAEYGGGQIGGYNGGSRTSLQEASLGVVIRFF
jgi:hypothetical protein